MKIIKLKFILFFFVNLFHCAGKLQNFNSKQDIILINTILNHELAVIMVASLKNYGKILIICEQFSEKNNVINRNDHIPEINDLIILNHFYLLTNQNKKHKVSIKDLSNYFELNGERFLLNLEILAVDLFTIVDKSSFFEKFYIISQKTNRSLNLAKNINILSQFIYEFNNSLNEIYVYLNKNC